MATLLNIAQQEIIATNHSNDIKFKVREILIGRHFQESTSFYRISNLSRTEEIQLAVHGDTAAINLSQEILERIASYIANKDNIDTPFDCASFIHYIHNIPYEFSRFYLDKWIFLDFTPESIAIGDSIMMRDGEKITHFAIYLGHELYLSKFGSSGTLIITTLEEMQKGFGCTSVQIIRPVKEI